MGKTATTPTQKHDHQQQKVSHLLALTFCTENLGTCLFDEGVVGVGVGVGLQCEIRGQY
jgi:hypothetical protein